LAFHAVFTLSIAIIIATWAKRWVAFNRVLRTAERFRYSNHALVSTSDEKQIEMRLLKIHRWVPWAGVRTTLSPVSITAPPAYEAISYTWGDPAKSHTMLVNERPFKTTAATYRALYNCSRWWSSRVVWIDYVCINQSDPSEKSSQVSLMKEIYTNAAGVLISLTTPRTPKGYQWLIESILKHLRDEHVAARIVQELSELVTHYGFSGEDLAHFIEREGRSHRVFRLTALSDFLSNPWFTRVWIVQEVAVARQISFLYEGQHMEWNSVWNVMNSFQEPEMAAALAANGNGVDLTNTRHFHTLSRIRTDTIKVQKHKRRFRFLDEFLSNPEDPSKLLPLTLLLAKCADFQATDGRDKVYAMLGLSSDNSWQVIQPDYEHKTTKEVYIEAAMFILGTSDPLSFLPFAGTGDGPSTSIEGLPSWVPDWSSPPGASALDQPLHNHYEKTQYYASLFSDPEVSLDSSTNILTLGGAVVDQVVSLAPTCHFPPLKGTGPIETYGTPFHPAQISNFIEWHDESVLVAFGATKLRASKEEDFWRTLIGDMTPSSRPAPAQLGEDYRRWIDTSRLVHRFHMKQGKGDALPSDLNPASPEFAIWGTAMGLCAVKRRVCVTSRGYLGMVPPRSKVGDSVAIFLGVKTPYVLRKTQSGMKEMFELVGECYVDGMMDGEMMSLLPRIDRIAIV